MDISKVDKNFVTKKVCGGDYDFYGHDNFQIFGLPFYKEDKKLCRLPQRSLAYLNEHLNYLSHCMAGARIRFRSNSSAVAIKAKIRNPHTMPHMPSTGGAGFDLYVNKKFMGKASPDYNTDNVEALMRESLGDEMKDFTINFPLYNGVIELEIGVSEGAVIESPKPYTIEKPIVFYGSSITQGGCASRPGLAYTAILSKWLDADHVNLGFSGNAKGEPEVADIIKNLDMSAFVYDYDHNAPTYEHLTDTHEPFFKIIREANKDLPIIIVSKPNFDFDVPQNSKRRDIIYATYESAIKSGDKNVYFVDGEKLFGTKDRDECTVDNCHPNDIGFMRMAETIYPVLKEALK